MKIIHGMSEVAGQGINTVRGLRANGQDATMSVWKKNAHIDGADYDLEIDKKAYAKYPCYAIKMLLFGAKALLQNEVVHSHYGHSFIPFCLDAYFYRLFRTRAFAEFHGSELRFLYKPDLFYSFYSDNSTTKVERFFRRKKINRLISRVNGIILHDYELIPHLPTIDVPIYIVPLRVDVNSISPSYPKENIKKKPIIVHAPSKRSTKGTEGILEALNKVEGEYELVLVENMSHTEAMKVYKNADIVIDQIAIGTYGVFSIEAMAMGKPVVTYISPEMKGLLPKELPIVSADFNSLPAIVDELIEDPQKRYELGKKGRAYAERYHDHIKVTEHLYNIYKGCSKESDLFKVL